MSDEELNEAEREYNEIQQSWVHYNLVQPMEECERITNPTSHSENYEGETLEKYTKAY